MIERRRGREPYGISRFNLEWPGHQPNYLVNSGETRDEGNKAWNLLTTKHIHPDAFGVRFIFRGFSQKPIKIRFLFFPEQHRHRCITARHHMLYAHLIPFHFHTIQNRHHDTLWSPPNLAHQPPEPARPRPSMCPTFAIMKVREKSADSCRQCQLYSV